MGRHRAGVAAARGGASGRHGTPWRRGRTAVLTGSGVAVVALATLVVSQTVLSNGAPVSQAAARARDVPSGRSPATTGAPSPTAAAAAAASAAPLATGRLAQLVAARSGSSTSVAALDTATGASVSMGAGSGMTTASAVKLEFLESLLLQHQRRGTQLSDGELDSVTAMIEHSDNDAAEAVFWDIGGRAAVVDLEHALGLSTKRTIPGVTDFWGLTRTSAAEQLVLLRNLVEPGSPLDAAGRAFALRLMRNVESDQTWGVPVVAARNTSPAVKNGWLAISDDDDLWAVNSLGVVTTGGHTVLIAVMTQHEPSFDAGVSRVETLARAAAAAVRG